MKVYLAARYDRREEMKEHRKALNAAGITVTSRWLDEDEPLDADMWNKEDSWYIHTSIVDLQDIEDANAVIFFSENPLVGIKRGGRHVEMGYALGREIPVVVIGGKENVFHYLPIVYHKNSLEQFIQEYHEAY